MKMGLTIILLLCAINTFAQKNPTEEAQPIVAEGKLLYKSEMASWYGTDLFLEKYTNRENIGGYFSYLDNEIAKCIFYSNADNPKVIGTISFDSTYNINTAETDLTERDFTINEFNLYQIRTVAFSELRNNKDEFFNFYQNTNPNLIPLINGDDKKVYILTGPTQSGIVIFGNDYLLTFDENNNLTSKKQLHKNIIPIEYGDLEEDKEIVGSMHNHSEETGDFITATDICTLMLYSKFAKWKTHNVVSKKYLNIWNCESNQLIVVSVDFDKEANKNKKPDQKRK